jgi:hypothetical protein
MRNVCVGNTTLLADMSRKPICQIGSSIKLIDVQPGREIHLHPDS